MGYSNRQPIANIAWDDLVLVRFSNIPRYQVWPITLFGILRHLAWTLRVSCYFMLNTFQRLERYVCTTANHSSLQLRSYCTSAIKTSTEYLKVEPGLRRSLALGTHYFVPWPFWWIIFKVRQGHSNIGANYSKELIIVYHESLSCRNMQRWIFFILANSE